ncbi:DUF3221 domain-containing protein [Salimicrobium flavidum]|uniref:DUF3221 domain-containing protein n=1 Tax=Salimicrobium flavidum TaxID=570947 RepID=A0A1N7KPN7_9BACI|nr:DUF3221 domain-containing protein [Salimicrobium flavidum]SIS63537.1 Protein of unknown function [Salimicrobium flavidum]
MKKIFSGILFLVLIIWFFNQSVTEGYIYEVYDSSILVIELNESEVKGKTQDEIMDILEKKASNPTGNKFDIPFINEKIHKNFEAGQKIRVHWTGDIKASLPGQVDGTMLIITDD